MGSSGDNLIQIEPLTMLVTYLHTFNSFILPAKLPTL